MPFSIVKDERIRKSSIFRAFLMLTLFVLFINLIQSSMLSFNAIQAQTDFTLRNDSRLNPIGEQPQLEWQKTYGGSSDDWGYSVQQTNDGGYIVVGYTFSFGNGSADVYLIKVDNNGNLEWQKTYGGSGADMGFSVQKTNDGGYIITGQTESYGNGRTDVYLIKVDSNGNLQWQKTYGDRGSDNGRSGQQTSDGSYIIAGSTNSFGAGSYDVYLIKVDNNGNLEWQKTYGGSSEDKAYSVQQTNDGGYIVVGYTTNTLGFYDVYLIKVDSNGNLQWQKTYGGSSTDEVGYDIWINNNGEYIIVGYIEDPNNNTGSDVLLMKVDNNGNLEWQKTYGGSSDDVGESVKQTNDGGYIVVGVTKSYGNGGEDVYLIKLAPEETTTSKTNVTQGQTITTTVTQTSISTLTITTTSTQAAISTIFSTITSTIIQTTSIPTTLLETTTKTNIIIQTTTQISTLLKTETTTAIQELGNSLMWILITVIIVIALIVYFLARRKPS